MNTKELTATLIQDNDDLIRKINKALTDINGRKHLPLWIEQFSHGRLENLSADTLQGIKLGIMYSTWRMKMNGFPPEENNTGPIV